MYIFLSSSNAITEIYYRVVDWSVVYKLYRKGEEIAPWGTLTEIWAIDDISVPTFK